MTDALVMTIIGQDRPGLVESIAKVVADHGGNWLESRMCQLGGEFAGILRIQVQSSQKNQLIAALEQLSVRGLNVVVRPDSVNVAPNYSRRALLEIVGHDRPGIVRQISSALAGQSVNVEELSSECESAPMTGEILFKAQITLQIPGGCSMDALQQNLEKIAGDLMVDFRFAELNQ
jgi:glycine cleavage system regulatory protein